jgi:hypothetical protein
VAVALSFIYLELLERFDALQQSIQVTSIARKAAPGWHPLLKGRLVFPGFCLKRLDEVVKILRHGVLRCPCHENVFHGVRFPPGSD